MTGQLVRHSTTYGDAAVDGLLAGFGAGVVMGVYLAGVGLLWGEGPGAVLARFSLCGEAPAVQGALTHLAVAGVYGVTGGLLYHTWRRFPWLQSLPAALCGLGYGLFLLAVAQGVFATGISVPLSQVPPLQMATAHALYGLSLGALLGRSRKA